MISTQINPEKDRTVEDLIGVVIIGFAVLAFVIHDLNGELVAIRGVLEKIAEELKPPQYGTLAGRVIEQLKDIEKAVDRSN